MKIDKFEEEIKELKKGEAMTLLEEFKLKQTNEFIEKIEHLRRSLI